jgi:hypothetical protein
MLCFSCTSAEHCDCIYLRSSGACIHNWSKRVHLREEQKKNSSQRGQQWCALLILFYCRAHYLLQYFWELVPGSWLLIIFLLLSSERREEWYQKLLSAGLYLAFVIWMTNNWGGEFMCVWRRQTGLAYYANWLTFFYWSSLCHSYFDWGELDTI